MDGRKHKKADGAPGIPSNPSLHKVDLPVINPKTDVLSGRGKGNQS